MIRGASEVKVRKFGRCLLQNKEQESKGERELM